MNPAWIAAVAAALGLVMGAAIGAAIARCAGHHYDPQEYTLTPLYDPSEDWR